ncbi:hypothetical protein TSAR_004231 [Trichomalopsis sarcophagae]|uniref:Uncharacterized protein n=1 Tax=Trichomalopsis sarcophagae TaxID=543379 RepID=A0A232EQB7_9HYME|nr:hypothetical protein TSAR_004231 [Trichomalopsis sarcophagae]
MSRRVQCVGGCGATTERLPCKPEDLGSSSGSVTFSLHSSLVTFSGEQRQVEECDAVVAVARRQNVYHASQRISVEAQGPSLFRCTLHS